MTKKKEKNEIKDFLMIGLLAVLLVFSFFQAGQISSVKEDLQSSDYSQNAEVKSGGSGQPVQPAPQAQMVGGC